MPLPPTEFTPFAALIGGAMIGLAAVLVMALLGRIAGISGIVLGTIRGEGLARPEGSWRPFFLLGLILAPVLWTVAGAPAPEHQGSDALPVMALGGFLVGLGSILGSGCTSGHGVCGLSRLSARSLVAVPVFMATAGITVFVIRHLLGGGA